SAMGMQEGGAGAGARHEAAARAARPTSFCLAAEPLYGPPGRGDFLVADGMWSRSTAMPASQAPRGETDGLASIPCSRTPAGGSSTSSWRGRLTSFSRFFSDAFGLEFYVRRLAKHGVGLVSITQELGDEPAQGIRVFLSSVNRSSWYPWSTLARSELCKKRSR